MTPEEQKSADEFDEQFAKQEPTSTNKDIAFSVKAGEAFMYLGQIIDGFQTRQEVTITAKKVFEVVQELMNLHYAKPVFTELGFDKFMERL